MKTTELIELLKSLEKGASGRSREISIVFESKKGRRKYFADPEIKFDGSGDGTAGAELTLLVKATEQAKTACNCYVLTEDIALPEHIKVGWVSDGYHTFDELYEHRVRLFSTLMKAYPEKSWWSRKHSDGDHWDGWIIAGIETPSGTATYHLPDSEIEHLGEVVELPLGKEWDGHTPSDVLERLLTL